MRGLENKRPSAPTATKGLMKEKPQGKTPSANGGSVQRVVIPLQALRDWNNEMFEEGVEADLHDAGIDTLARAYRQGKEDQISELIAGYGERDNDQAETRRRTDDAKL